MFVNQISRRRFLKTAAASLSAGPALIGQTHLFGQEASYQVGSIRVLNPRGRVPLSFIIDDSTCLVNMGHFCMPQFANAWPDRDTYKQPWRDWPREIPDSFVREFGEWCAEHDVKGKYSIVPYPACVGWLDRELPGWSRNDLENSLALVRDLMMPNWDIHPEMITHTRVIDLKTGRPMEKINAGTMENSYPQTEISTDHLASYLAYALRILKNCGLDCEGITTPGGFGNGVKDKLPVAVHQAVRDVFSTDLPHFFKYVKTGSETTKPRLDFVNGKRDISNLTMNVPAGTGDWFGGWEGTKTPQPDRYCNEDATAGRMVDLIERDEPAVMLCHWPGMYCNATKAGFEAFKRVVVSLDSKYKDQTRWMKVSEIGRYWAAKEMCTIRPVRSDAIEMDLPLECNDFTVALAKTEPTKQPTMTHEGKSTPIRKVDSKAMLGENTFAIDGTQMVACLNAPKGKVQLEW